MAKGVRIKEIDHGYNRIVREVNAMAKKPYVKVGYLESSGGHRGSNLSVAEIASVHEFGTEDGSIPERSFMRSSFDENVEAFNQVTQEQRSEILLGNKTTNQALGIIGQKIQSAIQKKITEGDASWEPLAPATVERKGSSKPLIDTGQMRAAVRYEVVNKS